MEPKVITANPLFEEIRNTLEKTIVLQGGAQAGKTWETLQNFIVWSIENPGEINTITAESIPNLKKGALRLTQKILNKNPHLWEYIEDYNKSDRLLTFKSGSIIEYTIFETEQDAKGSKRDRLFVNECDAITWEVIWQLLIRTSKKIIFDYNPTCSFWCHEKIIGKPDTRLIISDHRHNQFLDDSIHKEIESIADPELWKVYARGLTGQLKASIYTNWQNISLDQFPKNYTEKIWAIDYGYGSKESSGKTAIIKILYVQPNKLYLRECCYHPGGMDEHQIKQVLEKNGWENGDPYYSEHDPAMVSAQRRLNISIRMAIKGERSEWYGIMKIKKFSVYYSSVDENLQYEKTHYRWVSVGEIITNVVEETRKYHLMAALRYGVYTHFFNY